MTARRRLIIATLAAILTLGCASSGTAPKQQVLAQIKPPEKKGNLDQQLALLGGQGAPKDSRDYQLGSEDLLEIKVYGQEDLSKAARIDGKGEITMPLLGPVKAEGLTPQKLERRLEELYGARFLKNPQVSIFVKEYRHRQVAVTGAVKKPGFYELIGPRNLLEMLAVAGGLDDRAGDWVHVIRTRPGKKPPETRSGPSGPFASGSETIIVDMKKLAREGSPNVVIQQGDVVNVPYAGLAYVLGSVNKPGSVPVKDNLTVSQAVAVAGSPVAGLAKPEITTILRLDDTGQAVNIPVNLYNIMAKKEPDILLKEQDVIFVPESSVRRFLLDFRQLVGGGMSVGYSAF